MAAAAANEVMGVCHRADGNLSRAHLAAAVFRSPIELYRTLVTVWAPDTASPSGSWTSANPAKNHCSVTAIVFQDHFGGDILKTRTRGGNHFYNQLDGRRWDITAGQFDEPIGYDDVVATRDEAFADTTVRKYELLSARLSANARRDPRADPDTRSPIGARH